LNPLREPPLVEPADCHIFHDHHCFSTVGCQPISVRAEKDADGQKLPHEFASGFELLFDVRIVRRQQDAVGRFHGKESVTLMNLELRQHLLGKDGARGGADLF
jgi:hypothetical protein